MNATGTLHFTSVTNSQLVNILSGLKVTGVPFEVYCKGIGATRTGEKIDFTDKCYPLCDHKITSRKQFFTIAVNGTKQLVRPFSDTFTEILVVLPTDDVHISVVD